MHHANSHNFFPCIFSVHKNADGAYPICKYLRDPQILLLMTPYFGACSHILVHTRIFSHASFTHIYAHIWHIFRAYSLGPWLSPTCCSFLVIKFFSQGNQTSFPYRGVGSSSSMYMDREVEPRMTSRQMYDRLCRIPCQILTVLRYEPSFWYSFPAQWAKWESTLIFAGRWCFEGLYSDFITHKGSLEILIRSWTRNCA